MSCLDIKERMNPRTRLSKPHMAIERDAASAALFLFPAPRFCTTMTVTPELIIANSELMKLMMVFAVPIAPAAV